jgi:hypothetical protein
MVEPLSHEHEINVQRMKSIVVNAEVKRAFEELEEHRPFQAKKVEKAEGGQ